MKSILMKLFCHALPIIWTFAGLSGALAQSVRVVELLENTSSPTADVMDDYNAGTPSASGPNTPRDLSNNPNITIRQTNGAEIPLRTLSGLVWGSFNSALGETTNQHDIEFSRTGISAQTFLRFTSHRTEDAADFPSPYNETNGSYIYTLFSSSNAPTPPDNLDITGGTASFKLAANISNFVTPPQARFLIQTDDLRWYRSNVFDLQDQDINLGAWFTEAATSAQKEALFNEYLISSLTWERVSAAAETGMNSLQDGNSAVALGATQTGTGNDQPNLLNVTGMGLAFTRLDIGSTVIHPVIGGLVLQGAQGSATTPTPTPIPTPQLPVTLFMETWENITTWPMTYTNPLVATQSDEGFTGLVGFNATPASNVVINNLGGNKRLQRRGLGLSGPLGATSASLGNSLQTTIQQNLDEDAVTTITMEIEIFAGALTPDGTANFPAPGAHALASLTSVSFTIGDDFGGLPVLNSLPAVFGGRASYTMNVNNNRTGSSGLQPRLLLAINDASFGVLAGAGLIPPATHIGTGFPAVGVGQRLQGNLGTQAQGYRVGVTFRKNSFNNTTATFVFVPTAGTATTPVNGAGSITIASSFPFNRRINAAGLNVGSGYGVTAGAAEGSWVDNIKVFTFGSGTGGDPVTAVQDWEVFE